MNPPPNNPGRLEVLCGPMFSGKTSELITRVLRARESGFATTAIKPARDDRYAHTELVSHAGARIAATPIANASDLLNAASSSQVIGIDEAHFFGNALIAPVQTLLHQGARIILAGIERDHRGNPFDPFPTLLCEADEVVKLSGPCHLCGRPAIHSQRMIASNEAIVVGGANLYQARCRACFQPPRD